MSGMAICRVCAIPYDVGPTDIQQKCLCRRSTDDPRWVFQDGPHRVSYDYNEHTTLCHCCVAEKLRSGSKWSVWFCDQCKQRVIGLNRRVGLSVIPIGRHSLMHGVGLTGKSTGPEVHAFTRQLKSLFGRMDDLFEWRRIRFAFNAARLGDAWHGDVELDPYLEAVSSSRDPELSKAKAFEALCEHFDVPIGLLGGVSVTPARYPHGGTT